ncbi:MAG: methyltransferase domain-containing protein [Myxococcales bacterium]|nr:methyltransferase domain-containing protein [Myxococcales bacterium]
MTMTEYIMESPDEGLRLEKKTDDEFTRRLLAAVGTRAGMCVLDAGAGTGAVARVMSDLVGVSGSVTALDISKTRLAEGKRRAEGVRNLVFHHGDVIHSGLEQGAFDLVWCRFVLEYLPNPQLAVTELVKLAKPGGKVVLADLDGNALFHYPMRSRVAQDLDVLMSALQGSFDPYVGRKLYHFAHNAGLKEIRAHVIPYHLYPGAASSDHLENWRQKLKTVAPKGIEALGSVERYESFAESFMDMLAASDTFYYSVLILVEGLRPL